MEDYCTRKWSLLVNKAIQRSNFISASVCFLVNIYWNQQRIIKCFFSHLSHLVSFPVGQSVLFIHCRPTNPLPMICIIHSVFTSRIDRDLQEKSQFIRCWSYRTTKPTQPSLFKTVKESGKGKTLRPAEWFLTNSYTETWLACPDSLISKLVLKPSGAHVVRASPIWDFTTLTSRMKFCSFVSQAQFHQRRNLWLDLRRVPALMCFSC